MVETASSSSSGSSGSSSASQSAVQTAQSSQLSQTSKQSQSLQSLESAISQNSAKEIASDIVSDIVSGLKQADPKSYLLAEKIKKEGKKQELYKKELAEKIEGKQLKNNSKNAKYIEADICTTSKKCHGTMTPINPDSSKPINMADSIQFWTALYKYSLDSMAHNADLFTSLAWKLLKQMYCNAIEKQQLPCAEAAFVCY